jgi:hypothetical protein
MTVEEKLAAYLHILHGIEEANDRIREEEGNIPVFMRYLKSEPGFRLKINPLPAPKQRVPSLYQIYGITRSSRSEDAHPRLATFIASILQAPSVKLARSEMLAEKTTGSLMLGLIDEKQLIEEQ